MAYTPHTFVSGTRLYAATMSEMDNQIANNAENIDTLLEANANVPNTFLTEMNKLSIEVDSDTLYLKYGDYLLGSCPIPLNLDNYVPCTRISITNGPTNNIMELGDSFKFYTSVSPSNTTQNVRWSLSDLSISSINNLGTLIATGLGTQTVYASCGQYQANRQIKIQKTFDFGNNIKGTGWVGYNANGNIYVNPPGTTSSHAIPYPYNLNDFAIEKGRSIHIGLKNWENSLTFNCYVFKQADANTPIVVQDLFEDDGAFNIKNIEKVSYAEYLHDRTKDSNDVWGFWGQNEFNYTNNTNETMYFFFAMRDSSTTIWANSTNPSQTAADFIAQHVEVILS